MPSTPMPRELGFKDPQAYPVLSIRVADDAPRVFLGYSEITKYGSGETIDMNEFGHVFDARGLNPAGNKVIEYHFDTNTLQNSKLAQAIEGSFATPNDLLISLKSVINGFGTMNGKNAIQEVLSDGPTDYDRAAIMAIQKDLERRGYKPTDFGMADIERMSRDLGNPPSTGYPGLDREDKFQTDASKFYESLTPEQKSLYVGMEPSHEPQLFHITPGDGGSIMPNRFFTEQVTAWRQGQANEARFEKEVLPKLSPDQQQEWARLKKEAAEGHYHFQRPDDGIKLAPDAPVPDPSPDPMIIGPKYPVKPDVLAATPAAAPAAVTSALSAITSAAPAGDPNVFRTQQQLKQLDVLANVPGIDLGTFGANHDGLDGRIGIKPDSMTKTSIIAAKKYLGIEPPTAEITPEFTKKLEERVQQLTTALTQPAPVATPKVSPGFGGYTDPDGSPKLRPRTPDMYPNYPDTERPHFGSPRTPRLFTGEPGSVPRIWVDDSPMKALKNSFENSLDLTQLTAWKKLNGEIKPAPADGDYDTRRAAFLATLSPAQKAGLDAYEEAKHTYFRDTYPLIGRIDPDRQSPSRLHLPEGGHFDWVAPDGSVHGSPESVTRWYKENPPHIADPDDQRDTTLPARLNPDAADAATTRLHLSDAQLREITDVFRGPTRSVGFMGSPQALQGLAGDLAGLAGASASRVEHGGALMTNPQTMAINPDAYGVAGLMKVPGSER